MFLLFPLSVGPLHSDRQYDISATKEGFVLSPVEETQGDFKAFALAGVTFKVDVCTWHTSNRQSFLNPHNSADTFM